MNNYEIFEYSSNGKFKNYEAIKKGWSWVAFFFTFWWALYKGLFKVVGRTASTLIIPLVATRFEVYVIDIYIIMAPFIYGYVGNEWLREHLNDKGFKYKASIMAANRQSAIQLYIEDSK